MFKVNVFGPNLGDKFFRTDRDVVIVNNPDEDVTIEAGVLSIRTGPIPERPHPNKPGEMIPAVRSIVTRYPVGSWDKVSVLDIDKEVER